MALIMEDQVEIKKGFILVDKVKVAKITEDSLEFLCYRYVPGRNNKDRVDPGKQYKVDYFRDWILGSQTKTAKELCEKYF